jgi:hypothetical protein
MLIVVLLVPTACAGSIGSTEPPNLAPAPIGLTQSCKEPVVLPSKILTQLEVEKLWIRDRSRLIECGLQLKALIEFYATRDKRITKK